MGTLLKQSVVALCGLVTSVLVALLVTVGERLTGFDFFTLSVWVIVPGGAILTGLGAASGYYFGSLYFHTRPTALLFFQMVVIAGLTFFLIYYLEYSTLVLDDGRRVSDYISFSRYFNLAITTAHYRFGRGAQIDTGEVGEAGYWFAVIQFVGFLVGGIAIFLILLNHPVCEICKKYLRVLAKTHKRFADPADMVEYHDALFALPMGTPEFAAAASTKHDAKVKKGSAQLTFALYGCPECKRQQISADVEVYNGRDWKRVDKLARRYAVPEGVDLIPVYRGPAK